MTEKKEKSPAPLVQSGEKSAMMLYNESAYIGGPDKIRGQLAELRDKLINDIAGISGMDTEAAEANVDHFLIGMRSQKKGGDGLYATEEGQRLWREVYKPIPRRKEEAAPEAKAGEKSSYTLENEYVISRKKVRGQLAELRDKLINDIAGISGMDTEAAEANVDHFLIGMRSQKKGGDGLYATELGQALWMEVYKPTAREKPKEKREVKKPSMGEEAVNALRWKAEQNHYNKHGERSSLSPDQWFILLAGSERSVINTIVREYRKHLRENPGNAEPGERSR